MVQRNSSEQSNLATRRTATNAWRRSSASGNVQLLVAGTTSAKGSSFARDSQDYRGRVRGTVATVRQNVCADGSAIDRAGEVAAGVVAASALQRAQRATADGRVELQYAVSLVRRSEHGRPRLGPDHLYEEPRAAVARRPSFCRHCGRGGRAPMLSWEAWM